MGSPNGLASLAALLKLQSPSNYTGRMEAADQSTPDMGNRNNALVASLAAKLGIKADGGASQQDYQQASDAQDAEQIAKATAPARVQGEYGLEGDRIKGQYGLAERQMETAGQPAVRAGQANLANAQADQTRGELDVLRSFLNKGKGGASDPAAGGEAPSGIAGMTPHIDARGGVSLSEPSVSAQGKKSLTSAENYLTLAKQVQARLEQEYPGIAQDPMKYGGVTDALKARLKGFAYNQGLASPSNDIIQMGNLGQVVGAMPYMQGRPSELVFRTIMSHLQDMTKRSPGANYQAIQQLQQLMPEMIANIKNVEGN